MQTTLAKFNPPGQIVGVVMTKKKIRRRHAAPSALAEAFADFPTIDVLERRLLDPSGPASLAIRLIDEPSATVDPTRARSGNGICAG